MVGARPRERIGANPARCPSTPRRGSAAGLAAADNATVNIDPRRHSPAAERNAQAIATELQRVLPAAGSALEIASGSGQHAAFLSLALPGWRWQPSDGDASALASISAWCEHCANVAPPLHIDVMATQWAGVPTQVDAMFCANLLHIAPWATCAALMRGAARHLADGGLLLLYGPYVVDAVRTAPSNLAFDADLRARDPRRGLHRLADVVAAAAAVDLALQRQIDMPANNLLLVFGRAPVCVST